MASQRAEQLAAILIVAALMLAWFGFDYNGHHYGLDPWRGSPTFDGEPYP